MYVPFAFDLIHVEQEHLRRRTGSALRLSESAGSVADEPTGRIRTFRRSHRRAATAC